MNCPICNQPCGKTDSSRPTKINRKCFPCDLKFCTIIDDNGQEVFDHFFIPLPRNEKRELKRLWLRYKSAFEEIGLAEQTTEALENVRKGLGIWP